MKSKKEEQKDIIKFLNSFSEFVKNNQNIQNLIICSECKDPYCNLQHNIK